jgi:hypothetical protein
MTGQIGELIDRRCRCRDRHGKAAQNKQERGKEGDEELPMGLHPEMLARMFRILLSSRA